MYLIDEILISTLRLFLMIKKFESM